ncbi:transaldolase family protein [Candidatus Dependentiae bacterium]
MKIFLDTANLKDIKYWNETGIVNGVTTNPTLLSKEGGDPKKLIKAICKVVSHGDVSVEVTETDPKKVYKQAKEIAALAKNVVVKIPCHKDYYAIIKKLVEEEIQINVTLVFTLLQSLFMCKLGVKYISPFIGRLDDIDSNGIELIEEIRVMIDEYSFLRTQVITASIRHVRHFHEALMALSDVATVPIAVLEKAVKHPLTDQGMKKFLDDWKKLGIKQFP